MILFTFLAEQKAFPNEGSGAHAARRSPRLLTALIVCLIVVGVGNALASVGYGLWVHDEGIEANAGMAVAEGKLLYRDFYFEFPPAAPYALALVFKLVGPSLMAMRVASLALGVGAVLLAAYLAYRLTRGPWAVLSVAVLATVIVRSMEVALPVVGAMFWLLLGTVVFDRTLRRGVVTATACGALMGFGAAWRLDLGAYFIAGCVALMIARGIWAARGVSAGQSAILEVKRAGAFCVGAVAVIGPVLGRFFAAAPRETYECLVTFPRLVAAHRDLPSPSPVIIDWHHAVGVGQAADPWVEIALRGALYMPVFIAIVILIDLVFAAGRKVFQSEAASIKAMLILSGIGLLTYGTVRCDLEHLWPLALVGAIFAPAAFASLAARCKAEHTWRAARAYLLLTLLGVYLAAYVIAGTEVRLKELQDQRRGATVLLPPPRGSGIHVTPESRYRDLLEFIDARVPSSGYLFVGMPTHTNVGSTDNLLYFLSGRPPATRWYQFDPGVTTAPWVQREIVADLERTRPPLVVIYLLGAYLGAGVRTEHGSPMLDSYLSAHYRECRRFGVYAVLERRGT